MFFPTLNVNGAEGAHGTEVLTLATANATVFVDRRNRMSRGGIRDHLDGTCGTFGGTVAAVLALCGKAVLLDHNGIADAYGTLFRDGNGFDGTRRTYIGATRTFGATIASLKRHLGLEQGLQAR